MLKLISIERATVLLLDQVLVYNFVFQNKDNKGNKKTGSTF